MKIGWKVHTPSLLREVLNNRGSEILSQPLNIFGRLLAQVAKRASELDDPELNILMMRLTLYEQADPEKSDSKEISRAYAAQQERLAVMEAE
jgi:hypothetical protein